MWPKINDHRLANLFRQLELAPSSVSSENPAWRVERGPRGLRRRDA